VFVSWLSNANIISDMASSTIHLKDLTDPTSQKKHCHIVIGKQNKTKKTKVFLFLKYCITAYLQTRA